MMETKELIATLREISQNYEEFGKTMSRVVDAVKPLKTLIGEPKIYAKDSRLMAAGIALIALPDPFIVTDVVGSGLVAAELIRRKTKKTTIMDVYKEFRKMTAKLENITEDLTRY